MTDPGLRLPAFCDSHVHLGLVDPAALAPNGIGRVLDLGWDPSIATTWLGSVANRPAVDIAGALLTAPGGYPITSGWAPPEAALEIPDEGTAEVEIRRMRRLGARAIKICLNSDAGPVWSDDLLGVVVRMAHASGLPVVAHAQGSGQAERAFVAGVDCLAHTPWTETLGDGVLRQMAGTIDWISTLDIHGWGAYGNDFARAVGNLERFVAAGGTVHYGTDLGNGPLPVGLNRRELEALSGAGLDVAALVRSLRGLLPENGSPRTATVIPGAASVEDIRSIDDLMNSVVVAAIGRATR